MQGPWEKSDLLHRQHPDDMSLLGQLMERSTSAPPISTENLGFGPGPSKNSTVFETSDSFYRERHKEDSLFGRRDSASILDDRSGPSSILLGLNDDGGRASVPSVAYGSHDSSIYSNGVRRDGRPQNGDLGPSPDADYRFSQFASTESDLADERFPRSQSAAPSLLSHQPLGPPPGLGDLRQDGGPSRFGRIDDIGRAPRAASTGVLPGDLMPTSSSVLSSLRIDSTRGNSDILKQSLGAVAKSVFDLRQDDVSGSEAHFPRPQTAAPFMERPEPESLIMHRSRSVSPPRSHEYSRGFESGHRRQPVDRPEFLHEPEIETMDSLAQSMNTIQLARPRPHQQPPLPHQLHDRVTMARHEQRVVSPQPQVVAVPVSKIQPVQHQAPAQQARQMHRQNQHQRQRHPQQQRSTEMSPQQPMYARVHSQQPLLHQQTYDAQPQIYYGNHSQPQQIELARPNIQILPNGQAVYVSPAPYTYTAMQYHPHQQLVHHQLHGGPHDQYVSVVPIQSAGGQVFWQQGDGQPNMAPVAIMAPPQVMAQINDPTDPAPRNSRSKRNVGGRGSPEGQSRSRRNTRRSDGKTTSNGTGGAISSPLLDEFRATKSREWTIMDIRGHVVEFCRDQNGSRFIQQRLELANPVEQEIVIVEVLPEVRQLRDDVFGNYVVQKLLEFGSQKIKSELKETLVGEVLTLSLQMYGCRVVQKALETLDENDLPRLLTEFQHNVLSCIQDQNGNHVIQKCIEVMSTKSKEAAAIGDILKADFLNEQIDFIVDDVLDNVVSLSCHPYGCRVLQRILEHCVDTKKERALDAISPCHKVLLDDCFGNYVVQHVICYGRKSDRDSILDIVIETGLLSLSKQKFASNVVEKLLKYGSDDQRNAVVREMLKKVDDASGSGEADVSVVLLMVRDAYANYVVQTALDVVPEGVERETLLMELNAHSAQLRNYTFAKHIVTKLASRQEP